MSKPVTIWLQDGIKVPEWVKELEEEGELSARPVRVAFYGEHGTAFRIKAVDSVEFEPNGYLSVGLCTVTEVMSPGATLAYEVNSPGIVFNPLRFPNKPNPTAARAPTS